MPKSVVFVLFIVLLLLGFAALDYWACRVWRKDYDEKKPKP